MLTKSTDCRPLKKAARQGGEPAKKGVYPVVNDRILQATPTRQAENPSDLECVSKCRKMQFRVGLPAVQGDFPQACWRQVKGNQRRNEGKDAVSATEFPAKCTSGIFETHSNSFGRIFCVCGLCQRSDPAMLRREHGRFCLNKGSSGACAASVHHSEQVSYKPLLMRLFGFIAVFNIFITILFIHCAILMENF